MQKAGKHLAKYCLWTVTNISKYWEKVGCTVE